MVYMVYNNSYTQVQESPMSWVEDNKPLEHDNKWCMVLGKLHSLTQTMQIP